MNQMEQVLRKHFMKTYTLGRDKYVIHGSGGLVYKRPRSGTITTGWF